MAITIQAIQGFTDNYFWLLASKTHAVIVDPGDAPPILEVLNSKNLTLSAILLTHHHRDHIGGVAELKQKFNCPVYGPAQENIHEVDHPLHQDDEVTIESLHTKFKIFDIPGHTKGHIGYFSQNRLFCGDTLFAGGCGRLFEGTPQQMLQSLEKIAGLPLSTQIYCAHEYTLSNLRFALSVEPNNLTLQERFKQTEQLRMKGIATVPSTLTIELETNPFLRCGQKALIQTALAHSQQSELSKTEVFSIIRALKDKF